jgi:TolA-binding protein
MSMLVGALHIGVLLLVAFLLTRTQTLFWRISRLEEKVESMRNVIRKYDFDRSGEVTRQKVDDAICRSQEQGRVAAEGGRVSAEESRVEAEIKREEAN